MTGYCMDRWKRYSRYDVRETGNNDGAGKFSVFLRTQHSNLHTMPKTTPSNR